MRRFPRYILLIVLAALMFSLAACGNGNENSEKPPQITEDPTVPPETEEPDEIELVEYRQWAYDASASSEYGSDDWSALQATGERDTMDCGDRYTAWASLASDTVETLEVYYATEVYATEVSIYQTYHGGQVVKVELIDVNGEYHTVDEREPEDLGSDCPVILGLVFEPKEYLVSGIRITVDQSVLNIGWLEIDAVELVGMVDSAMIVEVPETTEEISTYDIPEGYLWRIGGDELGSGALGGMDVDENGLLYMSDNFNGVLVFDRDGNLVNTIYHDNINNASDVKIGPNGNVYVASWGSDSIFVFTPSGELLAEFGEGGTGPGQFGWNSPNALAVGLDGTVYALDDNEDSSGEDYSRIQKFTSDGTYLGSFNIEEDYFAAGGLHVGPDGYIYVVGFVGGYIIKYDSDGTIMGRIGTVALAFTGPQMIDFDADGNIYVAIWTEASVVKLDPNGNLLDQFGFEITYDDPGWPEGGMYSPIGVAVLPDGSQVYVTDANRDQYFLMAFEFK